MPCGLDTLGFFGIVVNATRTAEHTTADIIIKSIFFIFNKFLFGAKIQKKNKPHNKRDNYVVYCAIYAIFATIMSLRLILFTREGARRNGVCVRKDKRNQHLRQH